MKVLIILIGIVAVSALVISIVCLLKKEKYDFLAMSKGNIAFQSVEIPDPDVIKQVETNKTGIEENKERLDKFFKNFPGDDITICVDSFGNLLNNSANSDRYVLIAGVVNSKKPLECTP